MFRLLFAVLLTAQGRTADFESRCCEENTVSTFVQRAGNHREDYRAFSCYVLRQISIQQSNGTSKGGWGGIREKVSARPSFWMLVRTGSTANSTTKLI